MYTKVHYERLIVATAHWFGDDVAVVQSTIYNGYQVYSSLLLSTDSICSSWAWSAKQMVECAWSAELMVDRTIDGRVYH